MHSRHCQLGPAAFEGDRTLALQAKSRSSLRSAASRRAPAPSPLEGTVWKQPTSLDELLQDLYDSQARSAPVI